jgi:hypothetical protein
LKLLRAVRDGVKHFEVPLFVVAAILGVYLAVASLLRGAKYPNEAIWTPWKLLFVLMVVAGVFVPVYAFYKALDAYFLGEDKEEAKLTSDLNLVCQRTVAAIAEACDAVSINDLSAQVWLCRPDGTFERRACFLLPEARPRSGIEWRKGRGIAGTAWAAGQQVVADLGPLKAQLERLGAQAFDQLEPGARYGMTAAEVGKTLHYAGVCAVPLFSQESPPQVLGIFVIDYMAPQGFDCVASEVSKRPVENYLAASEGILTEAKAILPV